MNSTRFILMFLLSCLLGCNSMTETIQNPSPIEAKVQANGVIFTLSVPRNTFDLTDTLEGTFRVSNQSSAVRRFEFSNIQQLGFRLSDPDGKVALFQPFIVSPALSSLQLQNGESTEYTILTLLKDHTGNYVSRGEHTLAAFLLDNNSPQVTLKVTIKWCCGLTSRSS